MSTEGNGKPIMTGGNGEVFPAYYNTAPDGLQYTMVDDEYLEAYYESFKPQVSGHATLDGAGLIPIAGGFADLVNGVWYYAEGDKLNATISMGAVLPIAEYGSFVAKYGDEAAAAIKWVDEALEGTSKVFGSREAEVLLDGVSGITGSNRDRLLSVVQNGDLKSIVNELYRPGATLGDGGTASALAQEFYEGSSKHLQKAKDRLRQLNNLAESGNLGLNDLDIVDALRMDLENSIKLFD